MPEREFEPQRMIWLAPLTILSAVAAVLAARYTGLLIVRRPPRFDMLGAGPSILDTAVLVTIAIFVFAGIASSSAERPRRRYRAVPWPPVAILMAEHVAAWFATVEILTGVA